MSKRARNRRSKHVGGFALAELLITASVMAIISTAIVSVFASGLKVFERARNYMGLRPDVLLCLEKMERDLSNVVNLEGVGFRGEKDKISFSAVIDAGDTQGSRAPTLGRITYYLDGINYVLTKKEQNYSQAVSQNSSSQIRLEPLARIETVNFSYYYYDSKTQSYGWKDAWEEPEEGEAEEEYGFPLGVKVRLRYKDGRKTALLERMVFFPVSVSGHKIKIAKEIKKGAGAE